MPETMTVNKSDWDRLFKASELGDKLLTMVGGTGNIADKSIDDLQRLTDNFSFNSYSNGIIAGKKSVVTPTEVPEEITNNGKKWILNGLNWIDGKLNGNYKQE